MLFLSSQSSPKTLAAALLIVGLIVGIAIGYFVGLGAAPTPVPGATATVTQTITETTTVAGPVKPKTITIKIWTIGPDPPSEYRLKNFEIAADMLNSWLEAMGANVKIEIDGEFYVRPIEWGEYKNKFYLEAKAGREPHIYLTGHEDIGFLAENGYIIPLDDFINEYWDEVYYDVIPTLWEAVKYKGKIWGIPQDTEVRPLYFRKDVLRALGWSEEEIEAFPKKIEAGEITLYDILEIAKEAKDKGLVKRGLVHRVKEGYDYFQFYLGFGGRLWDPEAGKMVFTKSAWKKTLQWFHDAVWKYGVIIPTQFSGDWDKDFHGPFTKGEALFCSGGSWHKGEWIEKGLLTEEEFKNNIGFALHPAGEPGKKPVTLSHPLVYTITKRAEKEGLAKICFMLITLVTDPHLNAFHAVKSAHLAILFSEIEDSRYTQDWFLHDVAYMLRYTTFIPNHPKWGDYSRIVFTILKAVETDKNLTPDKAFETLLSEIQRTLGDAVIIEE